MRKKNQAYQWRALRRKEGSTGIVETIGFLFFLAVYICQRIFREKEIVIEPGATIGIFGSGQLGRMLALEGRRMGYRIATFSPQKDTPTGQVADNEIEAEYEDLEKVLEFSRGVDVVTFEFENIPSETIEAAAQYVSVHPDGEVLHITQNRLREKTFLESSGFPIAPFGAVRTIDDLKRISRDIGKPGVLKTAGFGYDGKGQMRIESIEDIEKAFASIEVRDCVYEGFIDFEKEISVVCTRDAGGNFANYGTIENQHRNHILDVSIAPAEVSSGLTKEAIEIARGIADEFSYVGTLCVEFFLTNEGELLVNEIAPRPHNSGHVTFQTTCATSQFEQQLRAVCGLPLGSTEFSTPIAMVNLLGDLWEDGEPNWKNASAVPGAKLNLYGKKEARLGRKMGHITATGDTPDKARENAISARKALKSNNS